MQYEANIRVKLQQIYGDKQGSEVAERLLGRLASEPQRQVANELSEKTAIAIVYGDHIQREGKSHLETLHDFLKEKADGLVSHVHILPFYPYSSDDGFSVIDYATVDTKLGDWGDIAGLETDFGLMFDYVLNHISAQSEWFQAFLRDDPKYRDFFIVMDPGADVSRVRRPRTSPLLTPFETAAGMKYVWTTFSADQIDLNYANPEVLLAMIDVLLLYVRKGAEFIRMDAVTYLWKEIGTDCVHLRETHLVVQLLRDVLNIVAPHVRIITETNVPHHENISYFADGYSEAQGVYNFALPPLLVHTLQTGEKAAFEMWARSLVLPSDETFFFNFTASHDGIGVTPVKGILSPEQIAAMIERVQGNGGLVSYKTAADGSQEPYELNTTYYNALSSPDDDMSIADRRFMVSQAIMLAMKGVPGIYFGSLVGNKNWAVGPELLGYNRAINREKLLIGENFFVENLDDESAERGRIYRKYRQLLEARAKEAAFSPQSDMEVLDMSPGVIALLRTAKNGERILAIHSVAASDIDVALDGGYIDILTGDRYQDSVRCEAYGLLWLRKV